MPLREQQREYHNREQQQKGRAENIIEICRCWNSNIGALPDSCVPEHHGPPLSYVAASLLSRRVTYNRRNRVSVALYPSPPAYSVVPPEISELACQQCHQRSVTSPPQCHQRSVNCPASSATRIRNQPATVPSEISELPRHMPPETSELARHSATRDQCELPRHSHQRLVNYFPLPVLPPEISELGFATVPPEIKCYQKRSVNYPAMPSETVNYSRPRKCHQRSVNYPATVPPEIRVPPETSELIPPQCCYPEISELALPQCYQRSVNYSCHSATRDQCELPLPQCHQRLVPPEISVNYPATVPSEISELARHSATRDQELPRQCQQRSCHLEISESPLPVPPRDCVNYPAAGKAPEIAESLPATVLPEISESPRHSAISEISELPRHSATRDHATRDQWNSPPQCCYQRSVNYPPQCYSEISELPRHSATRDRELPRHSATSEISELPLPQCHQRSCCHQRSVNYPATVRYQRSVNYPCHSAIRDQNYSRRQCHQRSVHLALPQCHQRSATTRHSATRDHATRDRELLPPQCHQRSVNYPTVLPEISELPRATVPSEISELPATVLPEISELPRHSATRDHATRDQQPARHSATPEISDPARHSATQRSVTPPRHSATRDQREPPATVPPEIMLPPEISESFCHSATTEISELPRHSVTRDCVNYPATVPPEISELPRHSATQRSV
ncbi:uncharacterized protein LOC121861344 [Homarus americanus]|uniref:uncharacterized protein LOC121861344 n=1 Tax=Homarus americanus TaxID=6706 RepID=UPI001C48F01B|nr:uncharacterized protein LOC121861344 [Homarus americanus]